jgi:hypothetical protein
MGLIWYNRFIGAGLLLLGLAGFFIVRIPNFVQLDLWQSLVYLILGAVGLQLGCGQTSSLNRARYATATGLVGLIFLGFGLTFPNFADIFHLELPEHVFHLLLGLAGCLVGNTKKQN